MSVCDDTPSPFPPNTSTSSKHFNLGRWSSSDSNRGIAHFFISTRNTIKGVGGKKKEQTNIMAWISSKCKKRSYVTLHFLCICRLTLAWISSEISTKLLGTPTHLDWSSLTAAGLSLSCRQVSSAVQCRLPTAILGFPSSTAFSLARRQLPSLGSFFQLPLAFPCLLPVASRSRVQNPLSGFAPKQTKGSSARRTTYIVSHVVRLVIVVGNGHGDTSSNPGRYWLQFTWH